MTLTYFLKRDDTIKRELPRAMATPGELPVLSRPTPRPPQTPEPEALLRLHPQHPPSSASFPPAVFKRAGFFSTHLNKKQNSDHAPPITVSFLLYPLQLNSTEAKSLTMKPQSSTLPRLLTLIRSHYPPQQLTAPALVQTRLLPPSSVLGPHVPAVASNTTVHSELL